MNKDKDFVNFVSFFLYVNNIRSNIKKNWLDNNAKALQGQMKPLLCAAGMEGPALEAAAGLLCRWFVGGAVLPVLGEFQRRRQHSAPKAHRALPVCEWPALGMVWGTAS